MVKKLAVRQGYRFYAAVLLIWSAFTALWGGTAIDISATTIGYGWVAIAMSGAPVALGLYATRTHVFDGRVRDINRFNENTLSGWPLGVYAGAIVAWSVVFMGWLTGSLALSPTSIAAGWFLIAIYGTVLTVGLVSSHRDKVMDALHIRTPTQNQT